MNPFSEIIKVDKKNNLIEPQLITIGASVGGGKTVAINTMVANYVLSGINVILFSETKRHSAEILFKHIDESKANSIIGNLIIFDMFIEDTIQNFNKKIIHCISYTKGSCVIIMDGPFFENQPDAFSYTKLKNENTRFVIFEKYNKSKLLEFEKSREDNPYIKKRVIAEALRNLAIHFNTHVIVSAQHKRNLPRTQENNIINTIGADTSLLFASDKYISVSHNENIFTIKCEKNRFPFSDIKNSINCVLEEKNLILATII